MKNICLLVFAGLLFSCASPEENTEAVNGIFWESALKDDTSFLESIDVIPLETDNDILIKTPYLFRYLKAIDAYLLLDSRQIVYLFDGNGKHRSNSSACIGEGPQEYSMAVDAEYNPYSNSIELYNVSNKGSIHCYDLQFHWKRTMKLDQEAGFAAQIICLLKENLYALDPVHLNEEDLFVRLYDFSSGKTSVKDVPYYKPGYVAEINMMQKNFSVTDSTVYYTPDYMDYYFYQYDVESEEFKRIYQLDFGKRSVSKKDLDKLYGTGKAAEGREMLKSTSVMQEKNAYLLSSQYPLPIIRLINDSFVYVHFICNRKPHHLIYNRKTEETFGLTSQSSLPMSKCLHLVDNALYSILYPYELDKYINETSKKYLSKEALGRLENIKDEDNPVVIKYILKKE